MLEPKREPFAVCVCGSELALLNEPHSDASPSEAVRFSKVYYDPERDVFFCKVYYDSWRVLHDFLPYEIEAFFEEPSVYDANDPWHVHHQRIPGRDPVPGYDFEFWRRNYMNWLTPQEQEERRSERKLHERATPRATAL